ncbi:MAG: hypothetical protein KAJ86_03400 [Alphaproteobacteria bacterium]|nr:hypothetical protein [Alphaproteobacteria bacterium]
MSELLLFSKEEQQLLISLPYKIGMWVSYADDVDGEDDDALEGKALEGCIEAIARLHDSKPFIKSVAVEILNQSDDWDIWATQAFHVLGEAEKVVQILEEYLPSDQVKNYKAMLMEIATAVAQASGEFDAFDVADKEEGGFGILISKIVGGFSGLSNDDDNHPMNVSASEDSVIYELREVLKGKME